LNIGPAEAAAAEDQELKQLGEEVARVKVQKQSLQALQAREEELRSITERKKVGAKKPS
jgi:DNA recombination-dependent growth factor C